MARSTILAAAAPARSRLPLARRHAHRLFAIAAAIVVVPAMVLTPPTSSGAWFTVSKARDGNSISAATLQPISGLIAGERSDGVNISWENATQQAWASNGATAGVSYTVTRTPQGGGPHHHLHGIVADDQ